MAITIPWLPQTLKVEAHFKCTDPTFGKFILSSTNRVCKIEDKSVAIHTQSLACCYWCAISNRSKSKFQLQYYHVKSSSFIVKETKAARRQQDGASSGFKDQKHIWIYQYEFWGWSEDGKKLENRKSVMMLNGKFICGNVYISSES